MLIARVRHDRYSISARDVVTLKRSLQLQCCTHRNDNTSVRSFAAAGLYERQLQRQPQLQLRLFNVRFERRRRGDSKFIPRKFQVLDKY